MKPFGVWKYCLILFVLCFGILYSLPNLYSPDPAVQISYIDSSQTPDLNLKTRLSKILSEKVEQKTFNLEMHDNYVLVRLNSSEE